MTGSKERTTLAIITLGILVLSTALRLYGVSWGLPDVYEEAIPLIKAWGMWGWGPNSSLDLNPHFFNYPSLTLYCQFLGQGILYLGMRLWGAVHSTIEYGALYVTDKTPFLIMGRLITTLFGVATIWALYQVCRRVVSGFAACSAAFFLAICTFHIEKSQVVEVDVPLAFFCTLALWFIVRITEEASKKNYLLAGSAIGLAMSTKYPAAFLVIPLVVSHILAGRSRRDRSRAGTTRKSRKRNWSHLAAAIGLIAITFCLTSPFAILDASSFLKDLSLERLHMREGHFGLEASGTAWFYIRALSDRILGWPLLIFSVAGLAYRAVWRRNPVALVLASFVLPYSIAVASWSMKADRYLLPILPVALIFAAAAIEDLLRLPRIAAAKKSLRAGMAAVFFLLAASPLALAYPAHLMGYAPDTRTLARKWIEANVPSGAFIAAEAYGPELLSPHVLFSLNKDIQTLVLERIADRPQYAIQPIPMLQVYPERSAVFYDLRLYLDADLFIATSAVRARYCNEPMRFPRQVAFYDSLETRFNKLQVFSASGGPGPTITLYEKQGRITPFAGRKAVDGPRPLQRLEPSGIEALFYKNLGLNYEAFGFYEQAIACYDLALGYEMTLPAWYSDIVLGKTRCLRVLGKANEAISFLRAAVQRAPTSKMRERIISLSRSIQPEAGGGHR